MHWSLASLLLLAGAVSTAAVATLAWRRRHRSGAAPGLALLMAATTAWSVPAAFALAAVTPNSQLDWEKACFFGMGAVPLGCLSYAVGLSTGRPLIGRRPTWMLALPGAVAAVLAWNPAVHVTDAHAVPRSLRTLQLSQVRGPLEGASLLYAVVLLAVSASILAPRMARTRATYRWQHGAALTAVVVPGLTESVLALTAGEGTAVVWSPLAMLPVAAVTGWAIWRHRLLDLNPVDRDRLLDQLADPLVVVDDAGRIADANPAAQRLILRLSPTTAFRVGLPLPEPLATWLEQAPTGQTRLIADASSEQQQLFLDIRIMRTQHAGQSHPSTLLVIRDVTTDHQADQRLENANEQLVAHLGEIERLRSELEQQVVIDPLTGLFNRRYLNTVLPREEKLARRNDQPLSFALIDADHFKQVNDRYGHAVGDQVLIELTRLLRRAVRATDHAVRYGGEEILIVMPNANAQDAGRRCDAWRRAIAEHFAAHPHLPPITVSIGVATMPYHGTNVERVLTATDLALYAAKAGGRNQVALADAVMPQLLGRQQGVGQSHAVPAKGGKLSPRA